MNQILILAVIGVVVLGGGYFLLSSQGGEHMMEDKMTQEDSIMGKDDAMMEKEDAMMKKDDAMMKGEGVMMEKKGTYEAYAANKLALADSGDLVLFFRASWCPTCKALDANIKANMSAIPEGITILDVDYDNSTALKQKYGVTYQHTLVQVRSDGSMIKKWSGSPTLAALVVEVQ